MKLLVLIARVLIGGLFIGHGTQKLFGWFGGYGPDGTGGFFESLGIRPDRQHAVAAGATETASGARGSASRSAPGISFSSRARDTSAAPARSVEASTVPAAS